MSKLGSKLISQLVSKLVSKLKIRPAVQMATMLGGATPRTLCLIDEFGKGTNAQERISK